MRCGSAIGVGLALWAAAAGAQDAASGIATTRYVGARASYGSRLWDAFADQPLIVTVTGTQITSVAVATPTAINEQPAGAVTVSVADRVILPGLIDAHTHHATEPGLRRARQDLARELYGGVTTVRDMAGDARLLGELQREGLAHEIASPDIRYSALVAGADFFSDPRTHAASVGLEPGTAPWMHAVVPGDDLPRVVALAEGSGASGLKIYANLPAKTVRGLIAAAHDAHFPVWTHLAVYPATPWDSVGATSVSHVCMLARAVLEPQKQRYGHADEPDYTTFDLADPQIAAYGRALAAAGSVLDATVTVYPTHLPAGRRGCTRQLAAALTGRLVALGVPLAAGTDHDVPDGQTTPALYDELHALVDDVGLTPAAALRAATEGSAAALGAGDTLGRIAAHYTADFLFLRADPGRDLAHLESLDRVVHRGREVPDRAGDRSTPDTPPTQGRP